MEDETLENHDRTPGLTSARLPLELIYEIIRFLVPAEPQTLVPCSSATTKTLVALCRVSAAVSLLASRYLRQHCAYIDSDDRLRRLLICLDEQRQQPSPSGTRLLQKRPLLSTLTGLYLSPFGRSLDDQPTAIWTRSLLCEVAPTLRRLVIDMPLRGLQAADDHLSVRKSLREGLSALTALEEFVSVRDELCLGLGDPDLRAVRRAAGLLGDGDGHADDAEVWTLWPRLRRLALYNVDADAAFWRAVAGVPGLETVVLTRADALDEVCVKKEYLASAQPRKQVRVLLVNVVARQPRPAGVNRWPALDPEQMISVTTYDVPTSYYGDEDEVELCQGWVKTGALRGDLWDWEGDPIKSI